MILPALLLILDEYSSWRVGRVVPIAVFPLSGQKRVVPVRARASRVSTVTSGA